VTSIKLAPILHTACVLTSRPLYSLLYTHHAVPATSATMSSTPDNRPPGATDPARQDDLTATLNSIMAQLTTISNRLNLHGTTLAKHALLLDGTEGSAVAVPRVWTALAVNRTRWVELSLTTIIHCLAIIMMTCGIPYTGRSLIFPGMTASRTRFPGLIVVSLTSGEHGCYRPNKYGWPRCIWMVQLRSGTMLSKENMAWCHGTVSRSS
jgi:hypothetical protein